MSKINYQIHYNNWHDESTRENDLQQMKNYLRSQGVVPDADDSVLDIGCGMGNLLLALEALGIKDVAGVELDEHQASSCKEKGLNVEQINAIDYFKIKNKKYNYIFLQDVLEHISKEHHIPLLSAIYENLAPNGKLVLSVPNAIAPLGHYFEHIDWTHCCSFSQHSLLFVLKNAKFEHIQLRPSHRETVKIRKMKKIWIELFKHEFGMKDPIMTPSIVAVCFKDSELFSKYVNENKTIFEPLKTVKLQNFKRIIKKVIRKIIK